MFGITSSKNDVNTIAELNTIAVVIDNEWGEQLISSLQYTIPLKDIVRWSNLSGFIRYGEHRRLYGVIVAIEELSLSSFQQILELKQLLNKPVIILFERIHEDFQYDLWSNNSMGLLSCNDLEQLPTYLSTVVAGGLAVSKILVNFLRNKGSHREKTANGDELTDILPNEEDVHFSKREKQVLGLLANGKSSKDIANQLFISTSTARFHIRNIYKKLNVNSRITMFSKAQSLGLC